MRKIYIHNTMGLFVTCLSESSYAYLVCLIMCPFCSLIFYYIGNTRLYLALSIYWLDRLNECKAAFAEPGLLAFSFFFLAVHYNYIRIVAFLSRVLGENADSFAAFLC